jgi:serine/threonine-protein kinase
MIRLTERFVLEREIGSGGMSRVFLGRDEVLDRPVAIKLLKPGFGETDIGARFRREGRTAAKLSHPNIVQVYDAGEGEYEGRETSFIVMEYVPGGDLKELIDERGALSGADLAGLSGVAAGLAHAHARGVIHRDIKPHNILLDENRRPKLADFGIARALDATYATRTGSYLGTALYSAPEQLRGDKVTPKTDVYSLGATLYQAATGQPPFLGSPIEVASQHVSKVPTPPRELNDAVSESLETLILDCLKKDPDSRPTADEVRLGLLEAGRGVYDTRAYTEPPIAAPTAASAPTSARTERARPASAAPTSAAPTSAAPTSGVARSRPGGAAYGGRRRRGVLAALALLAVLALVGVIVAPTLLRDDGQSADVSGRSGGGGDAQGGEGRDSGGGNPTEQPSTQSANAQQPASPQASASEEPSRDGGGSQGPGGSPEEAAARTVEEFYTSAAEGDYGRAYELLTPEWRQRWFPTQADLEGTFEPVRDITFVEGPTADVSGDTATVTGITRAELATQTDRNSGTWELVNENGEWRINEWTVTRLSTQTA